jgi:hypothetical protein
MCKGIDPDRSMQLIGRCHDAGISVTLYVMIGFPTETREEAQLTLDTILANREKIQEVSARVFYLDETSEIFRRAREFDIAEILGDPGSDLQVYYDFRPGSGMDRREARRMYLRFTQALTSHFPVFQNTNMLYHELKSHYFLYLCKYGSWEALLARVLAAPVAANSGIALAGGDRPARAARISGVMLRFDRAEIDAQLSAIDSATLRPRYQADLVEDEDRERFDRELPPAVRTESHLLYSPRSAEAHCLSPAARELLLLCDGKKTVEAILGEYPPAEAENVRAALARLRELRLIETQNSHAPALAGEAIP